METSPRLSLPYILPSQAQKHVTHNEAVRRLDCLVQPVVMTSTLTAPPAEPQEGDGHIVGAEAGGDWTGHDGEIACFTDGAWMFIAPAPGWSVHDGSANIRLVFDGTLWAAETGGSGLPRLGVNTEADNTNRFAVAADAALFTHDGDDHRLTINKASAADTASIVFQTAWSGRAEFGLTGDDDWRVRISPDGESWIDALVMDATTGHIGILGQPKPYDVLTVGNGTGNAFVRVHGADYAGFNFEGVNHSAVFGFNGYSGDLYITNYTAADITFGLNSIERVRFTSTGRVGIGINNPTTMLHVSGPIRVGSYSTTSLPDPIAAGEGTLIYASDDEGGPLLAYSDGAIWRRSTDKSAI